MRLLAKERLDFDHFVCGCAWHAGGALIVLFEHAVHYPSPRAHADACVCACAWATNDIITKVKTKHAESENRQKKNTKQHKNNTETGDKHLRFCAGSQIRMRTLLLFFFLIFTRTRTCVLHGVHDSKPPRF